MKGYKNYSKICFVWPSLVDTGMAEAAEDIREEEVATAEAIREGVVEDTMGAAAEDMVAEDMVEAEEDMVEAAEDMVEAVVATRRPQAAARSPRLTNPG